MYQNILIPIDGSPTSDTALQEGFKLAKYHKAQIELVYVVGNFFLQSIEVAGYHDEILEATRNKGNTILAEAQSMAQQSGVSAEVKLLEACGVDIADRIVSEAKHWSADLIVIGTHGHTGFSHLILGSVAEGVIRSAHIPVLLIRST